MVEAYNKKNELHNLLNRRVKVAKLYLQGWSMSAIAMELCVTTGTVSNDLEAIREEWQNSRIDDFEKAKIQELAKIDHLEAEAWKAWERSCKTFESITERTEKGLRILNETMQRREERSHSQGGNKGATNKRNKGKEDKTKGIGKPAPMADLVPIKSVEERKREERVGNVAFLEQVAKCIEMRVRIKGYIKDQPVNIFNFDMLAKELPTYPSKERDEVEDMILEGLPSPEGDMDTPIIMLPGMKNGDDGVEEKEDGKGMGSNHTPTIIPDKKGSRNGRNKNNRDGGGLF